MAASPRPKAAKDFIRRKGAPIVVKADGLAAGKGVIIAETVAEAEAAVDSMLTGGQFGEAGEEVVIEEFLEGEEASFFALVDGDTALPLASAQDHKRAFDGDKGPNTGGMGAYSPAPVVTDNVVADVMRTDHRADGGGDESRGPAVQGRALCRAHADMQRDRSCWNTMSASAIPNARCSAPG